MSLRNLAFREADLNRLRQAGHKPVEDQATRGEYLIGGYRFFSVTGYWRSEDGKQLGYTIRTLIDALREQQKPAA